MKTNSCCSKCKLICKLLFGFIVLLIVYLLLTYLLGDREKALADTINVTVALASAAAAWGAFRAANAAAETVEEQKGQDQVTLWRSLSDEFDYKMKPWRYACGLEFKGVRFLLATYEPIMDFFETVAYLVRHNRLPTLTKHTFWHHFDAYYRACEESLLADNQHSGDPSIYEDCIWLHATWGSDASLDGPRNIDDFFAEEVRRNNP